MSQAKKKPKIKRPEPVLINRTIPRSQEPRILSLEKKIEKAIEAAESKGEVFDAIVLSPDQESVKDENLFLSLYVSKISRKAGSNYQYILCLSKLTCGTFLWAAKANDKAQKFTQEALAIALRCSFKDLEMSCCDILGNILRDQGDLESSIYWFRRGLKLAQELSKHKEMSRLQIEVADTSIKSGDWVNAVEILESMLSSTNFTNPSQRSLGDVYYQAHLLLGDICIKVGDHEGASSHYAVVTEYHTEEYRHLPNISLGNGRFCQSQHQPQKAIPHFQEALTEARLGRPSEAVEAYLGLMECYNELGLSKSVLKYGCRALRATRKYVILYMDEIQKIVALIIIAAKKLSDKSDSIVRIADELMAKLQLFESTLCKKLPGRDDNLDLIRKSMTSLARVTDRRSKDLFTNGTLTIDLTDGKIILNGITQPKSLTTSELIVFRYLRDNLNQECNRKDLYAIYTGCNREELYDDSIDPPLWNIFRYDAIGRMITRIRNKGISKQILKTVPGTGYMLVKK